MTPAELAKHQRDEDLRAVLSTGPGRRLVWRVAEEMGRLHSASYAAGDTHMTAYLEGRRSVAMDLLNEAQKVAPRAYEQMVIEAVQAERLKEEAAQAKAAE